ncbi:hypothetical protein DLREEDagr8_31900 [Dongia sp. agr-C8]
MVKVWFAGVRLAVSGAGASGMVAMRVLSPGLAPGPEVFMLLPLLPQAAKAATAARTRTREIVPKTKCMLLLPTVLEPAPPMSGVN